MTYHYPNGKRYTIGTSPLSASNYKPKEKNWTYGKRGMTFEEDTTDYNGVYKGRYIDFEAKETKQQSSFPLRNFHEHQIVHMREVMNQKGICFVLLRFSMTEEVFYLETKQLLIFWDRMNSGGRKSITKEEIINNGLCIPLGFQPRIDYIKIIDTLYHLND